MRVVILEGSRGVGKSTVARAIREKIPEITLVNPTGYHLDGKEGKDKIVKYYYAWLNMINNLSSHDSTFVFDRFFFTERVFSELYKEYDFSDYYLMFLKWLCNVAEVDIIFFTIDNNDELKNRLTRDKVPFGKVEESTTETLKQQELYKNIMFDFARYYSSESARLHVINTGSKSLEEVQEEVFKIIKREET
jgi:deoxyguanosine kinase